MVGKKKVFVEEAEPTTLVGKLRNRGSAMPAFLLKGADAAFVFGVVKVFGGFAYDRSYLKGKWFEHMWSPGWRWAYNGMFAKAFAGKNRGVPWPCSSQGAFSRNVDFHVDDINNFQGPVYFQTWGDARIKLGRGVWIARGCAIITSNHDPEDLDAHLEPEDVVIGDHCWLGSNVVVMPGVVLGPHTVVGANAVVTKSFPEGHCVIGGVPAKVIRRMDGDGD